MSKLLIKEKYLTTGDVLCCFETNIFKLLYNLMTGKECIKFYFVISNNLIISINKHKIDVKTIENIKRNYKYILVKRLNKYIYKKEFLKIVHKLLVINLKEIKLDTSFKFVHYILHNACVIDDYNVLKNINFRLFLKDRINFSTYKLIL